MSALDDRYYWDSNQQRLVPRSSLGGTPNMGAVGEGGFAPTPAGAFPDHYGLPTTYSGSGDYNRWLMGGAPLEGYGTVDPHSPTWYQHPAALERVTLAGMEKFFGKLPSDHAYFPVPAGYADDWDRAGFAEWYRNQPEDTRDATVSSMGAAARGVEQGREQTTSVIEGLEGKCSHYEEQLEANKLTSTGATQQALLAFRSSPTHQRLTKWSSPDFQAIPDELVAAKRTAIETGIGREHAKAIGGAVASASQRGPAGGALVPQYTAAAGFRQAGEMAKVKSDLWSAQHRENLAFRKWSAGELSKREAMALGIEQNRAEILARTAPPDPTAGIAAQLEAGAPIYVPDYTQFATQGQLDLAREPYDRTIELEQEVVNIWKEDEAFWRDLAVEMGEEEQFNEFLFNASGALDFFFKALEFAPIRGMFA